MNSEDRKFLGEWFRALDAKLHYIIANIHPSWRTDTPIIGRRILVKFRSGYVALCTVSPDGAWVDPMGREWRMDKITGWMEVPE